MTEEEIINQIIKERRWDFKATIIKEFHDMKSAEKLGTRKNKWRIEDTALLLKCSVGAVSENIKLAKALKGNDDLADLTREQALILLKSKDKRSVRA